MQRFIVEQIDDGTGQRSWQVRDSRGEIGPVLCDSEAEAFAKAREMDAESAGQD